MLCLCGTAALLNWYFPLGYLVEKFGLSQLIFNPQQLPNVFSALNILSSTCQGWNNKLKGYLCAVKYD